VEVLALQNFMQKAVIISHKAGEGSILYKADTRHPKCENRRFVKVQNRANESWGQSKIFTLFIFNH
jgi:hypothetical protein